MGLNCSICLYLCVMLSCNEISWSIFDNPYPLNILNILIDYELSQSQHCGEV